MIRHISHFVYTRKLDDTSICSASERQSLIVALFEYAVYSGRGDRLLNSHIFSVTSETLSRFAELTMSPGLVMKFQLQRSKSHEKKIFMIIIVNKGIRIR